MFSRIKSSLILLMAVVLVLAVSGCGSSLDQARQLNNEGKKKEALNMAIPYLTDEDAGVRMKAVKLVQRIGGNQAGAALTRRLDIEPDRAVQVAVIKAVGVLRYEGAADKLVEMAPNVRGEAFYATAGAMRNIGQAALNPLLVQFDRATGNKEDYKKIIIQVGPTVTDSIIGNLKGKSYFQNKSNYDVLVALRSPKTAMLLLPYIEDEEVAPHVVDAMSQLGRLAVDPTIAYLKKALKKGTSAVVRERLVSILGMLRSPKATPVLESLAQDDSDRVRIAVDNALKRIRGF